MKMMVFIERMAQTATARRPGAGQKSAAPSPTVAGNLTLKTG